MSERREPFYDALNECGPTTSWEPRPQRTMRDMVRYFEARREPDQCHLSTCWCGHFKPDWLELCFTCDPMEKPRWVK